MNKLLLLTFLLLSTALNSYSQALLPQHLSTLKPFPDTLPNFDNIHVQTLYHDERVSSFVITIKKQVPAHYHEHHTEHVYILSGQGTMQLGDKTIPIKEDDLLIIPPKTVHAVQVTSLQPLRVLSIQAPYFDGKDRINIEK